MFSPCIKLVMNINLDGVLIKSIRGYTINFSLSKIKEEILLEISTKGEETVMSP